LYRVTGFSCTRKGFQAWQRCQHHALLRACLGWLPDPEPDSPAPVAAIEAAPWETETAMGAGDQPVLLPLALALVGKQERAAAVIQTVEAAVERLADQLAAGHSEAFERTLAFFARFHRYSARNCLLIVAKCPQASLVAGMRRWNEFGYRFRSGR
jgi:hypothetical protein